MKLDEVAEFTSLPSTRKVRDVWCACAAHEISLRSAEPPAALPLDFSRGASRTVVREPIRVLGTRDGPVGWTPKGANSIAPVAFGGLFTVGVTWVTPVPGVFEQQNQQLAARTVRTSGNEWLPVGKFQENQ